MNRSVVAVVLWCVVRARVALRVAATLPLAVLCAAPFAILSAQGTSGRSFPLGLHVGIPQGEFAENVAIAGGLGGGAIFPFAGVLGFRAELGVMIYGAETRRVPLGGGALGLIDVDVTTTNAILGGNIGLELGVPGPYVRPDIGGLIGFSAFTTSSSVSGSNSADEAFASSTNSSDAAFAKTVIAGLYIPVGSGGTVIDIGARYNWNGEEVEYLTPGDITEDINGDIVLNPRRTRADLLTIVIGVSVRPRRMMSK